jgi:hypothetical protein
MKYLNYIHGRGVEVFIDSLRKIPIAHASDVAEYASIQTGQIKSYPKYVKPTQYSLTGKLTTDELTKRRKLEYLNAINSEVLLVLGSEHDAVYGNITNVKTNRIKSGVSSVSATITASGRAISDLAYEAEDVQGTGEVDVSDSDASGGTATQLSTQYDDVYTEVTQSDFALPEGDYKVFVRAKDTAQVADDLKLEMYNQTDSTSIGSTTKTLTADYALYESGTITVAADDVGDTIRIVAEKATGTTNTISIDFIGFARV